jgi:hypothetical protein
MRQCLTRSAPPALFHVAGVQNTRAEVASRVVPSVASHFHLLEQFPGDMCPSTFLTVFDSLYPLPQQRPWTNVQPSSALWSSVISTLRGQQLPLRQWTIKLGPRLGKTGPPTPVNAESTPGCASTTSPPSKPISWPLPPGFALESSGTQSRLDTKLWKKRSVTWRKPSCWQDSTTLIGPTALRS